MAPKHKRCTYNEESLIQAIAEIKYGFSFRKASENMIFR